MILLLMLIDILLILLLLTICDLSLDLDLRGATSMVLFTDPFIDTFIDAIHWQFY